MKAVICRCKSGGLCTCGVIANRATAGDLLVAALCIAVFLSAMAFVVWP